MTIETTSELEHSGSQHSRSGRSFTMSQHDNEQHARSNQFSKTTSGKFLSIYERVPSDFDEPDHVPVPYVGPQVNKELIKQTSFNGKLYDPSHFDQVHLSPVTKKKAKITKKQWLILFALAYGNVSLACCFSLLAPFFPQEAEKKGATPTQFGLIIGIYELVCFLAAPVFGKLMPYVTPRFMITSGMFVAGASSILFGTLDMAPPGNTFVILGFLVRIIEGLGVAAFFTANYTFAAVEFPDRVATIFSTTETLFGVGMIIGPTVGGLLYQVGGYSLPFHVMGGVLFVGALITHFLMADTTDISSDAKPVNFIKLLFNMNMILDIMTVTVGFVLMGYNDATLEPHLRSFGLQPAVLGLIFVFCGGFYAICTPGWGYLCDRMENIRVLCVIGAVCCFISFLIIGPAPFLPFDTKLWVVMIAQILLGFGMGGMLVGGLVHALRDTVRRGFPDDVSTYGAVSGLFSSGFSLGLFGGPSLGGYLLDNIGYRNGSAIMLLFQFIMICILISHMLYEKYYLKVTPKDKHPGTDEEKKPFIASYSRRSFSSA